MSRRPFAFLVAAIALALLVLPLLFWQQAAAQTQAHVVQPGDTLSSIARRYSTTTTELMKLNGITNPNIIRVGQALALPAGANGSTTVTPTATTTPQPTPTPTITPTPVPTEPPTRIYVVKPDDTLAHIAQIHKTTAAKLAELNDISPAAKLFVGQPLSVPVIDGMAFNTYTGDDIPVPGKYFVHIVQDGESLASIVEEYGTSLRRTLKTNNLADASQVKSGQRIVVPPPSYAELFTSPEYSDDGYPVYPAMPTTEKWISVDLSRQRLFAWEGDRLMNSFWVSTGVARTPTVTGVFRIWAKIPSQVMEGGSRAVGDYYYLPNVQWVQYFYQDYALHGAYWHSNWGRPMSHGCVNLRNQDAKWLYEWASPVNDEWKWYVSEPSNPGTLVIVHY